MKRRENIRKEGSSIQPKVRIEGIEVIRRQREVIRIVDKIWSNKRLSIEERDLIIEEFARRNEIKKQEISIEGLKLRIRENYFSILIDTYEEIIRNSEAVRTSGILSSIGEEIRKEVRNALPEAVKGIISIKERRLQNDLESRDKEDREYIVRKYIREVSSIYNQYGYILEEGNKKIDLQRVNIEGFDLSGLDLSLVVFGPNILKGVNLLNTGIVAEQLLKAKSLKDINVEATVLEEVLAQRYKLCLDVLNNIREQIEDARIKIDYIDDLYLLSFREQEMEGRDAIDVINSRLSGLVDQRIKNLAYFVMTSNQINLLPEEHENNFAKISYNTEEIYNSTNLRVMRIVEEMLKERGYSLPEDVISFVIFNKLYQLYNAITDSSQTIGDVEGILEELDEEREEKIRRKIDILKNLRKENLRDEKDVKSYHDLKSIEKHINHLNDAEDIAIGARATDRLEVILDIAKESKQEVDLRDIDLANIDFKRIDFSELGIKLLLTAEQENKYLSMEQRQQRYGVLFERVSDGDIEGVEEALSRGLNINTGGEFKKTALVYACEAGRYGVVRWLVERGADVKVLSQGERSLLMHVCSAAVSNEVNKEERVEVINYLIEQGVNINLRDREGMTALMHACVSGQLPAIEKLIENGAEVNIANEMGRTALMVAGYHGWLEIVKILVERGADINARTDAGWKIIEGLLHGEQPENIKQIVEYLMSKGAELSIHNAIKLGDIKKIESLSKDELKVINDDMRGGAVHAAVREGRVDILEILRKKGIDLRQADVYGSNALHIACEIGKADIVGYLIREGLDVNVMAGKSTPIQIAIKSGNLQIASMLKKAGAKPDLEGIVALQDKYLILRILEGNNVPNEIKAQLLHLCCKYNWVEVTKELIEKYGVNINEEIEGVRAIEIACELGNVEIIELLMKYRESKGLELNNGTKEPLLFKAINKNDERILDILLSNGAEASIVYGWLKEDALLYAIRMIDRNKADICGVVKRLIESGADMSHKDSRGNTVLHYIAEEGNEDLAKIVLEGFKNIKNSEGKTAAQIAKEKGHILRIFEEDKEIGLEEENVIPIEEIEGFINVIKPSKKEKGKEKVFEEVAEKSLGDKKNNTKQTDKKEKLLEANMRGDDRNLLVDGHNRYWYSVSDGFRLLMHIRKTKLSYDNSIPVNEGEEYNAYRENREGIFIADPYHVLNFKEAFKDDIKRLSGQYTGIMGWNNTIKTIIIPLLDGLHWRSIRVSLHEDNRVSILWDDPYGKNGFTEGLKNLIKQSIINTLSELCEAELEVEEVEKAIDQQGKGINGYDCGPIVFSNISDYADSGKSNSEFTKISQHMYTIGEYSEKLHNQNMRLLRRVDVRRYAEMSGMNIENIEDRRLELEDRNIQLLQDKIGAIKLELLSDKQLERIKSLPALYISMVFDIVENNHLWKGDKENAVYSTEELTKAYNQVMNYKQWVDNICTTSLVSDQGMDIPRRNNPNTGVTEPEFQRRDSRVNNRSSWTRGQPSKKDNKDCIVSAVYSASYDNPILNDKHVDKLLEAANLNYGVEGVDKLIEIGSDINSYKKFQSLRTILSDDVAIRLYIKQELGKEQNINKGFIERLGINHSTSQNASPEKYNKKLSYTEKLCQEAELNDDIKYKAVGRGS